MKNKLLALAFQKVENQSGSSTESGRMKFLAEKLEPYCISGASDRNLFRYYKKYLEGNDDPISPKAELLDAISEYLEYDDYEDFVTKNKENNLENSGAQNITQIGKNNLVIKENNGDINLS